jgi:hypothetical protein
MALLLKPYQLRKKCSLFHTADDLSGDDPIIRHIKLLVLKMNNLV